MNGADDTSALNDNFSVALGGQLVETSGPGGRTDIAKRVGPTWRSEDRSEVVPLGIVSETDRVQNAPGPPEQQYPSRRKGTLT